MSLPDWECYLRPLQSLVVSLLLYLVSTLIFFRTGGVQPHRNSSTHRFLDFYRETCASSSGLFCPLSSTLQRTRPSVRFLSLSRIGRIEDPSCSACAHSSQETFHLIRHCPSTESLRCSFFGNSLSLYHLFSRPWVVSRLMKLHGLPPCPHRSEGVR